MPSSDVSTTDRRNAPRRRGRGVAAAGIVTALSLLASACEPSSAGVRPTAASVTPETSAARLRTRPASGVSDADPAEGISVTVERGTITDVTARTLAEAVKGRLASGKRRWHSSWALNTDARYTVVATAVDRAGRTVTERSTFRTLDPARTFDTHIFQGELTRESEPRYKPDETEPHWLSFRCGNDIL
jgi:hypothetical protein